MKKIIGVITARMDSTRLPGKVLANIAGKSLFAHHVERMLSVKGIEEVFLATSSALSERCPAGNTKRGIPPNRRNRSSRVWVEMLK